MNTSKRLRMMVVDDTIVYRKIVSDVLAELPDVEVVGTANNGKIAMSRIAKLQPDLITLDIEMPEMNGLEVLHQIKDKGIKVGAIMLSTLTHEGGEMTIKALELGAFDFIPKPQSGTMAENIAAIKDVLVPMIKAFRRRQEIKSILRGKAAARDTAGDAAGAKPKTMLSGRPSPGKGNSIVERMKRISGRIKTKSEIIGIGISTGGPGALSQMMPKLPEDIGVPILIVQHMPPIFTNSLANSLNSRCAINVREAKDGEIISPGTALIAPGGKQMKIVAGLDGTNRIVRITDDPPENSCKPSVDYLFRSIAHHYVGRATGVIMTGMGSDGTAGLQLMKQNGSIIIAQDEETCTVFGMPREPINLGIVDVVASLDNIAAEIISTVKRTL